jgi:hypothetical protein
VGIAALCHCVSIANGVNCSWSEGFLEAGKGWLAGDTARQAATPMAKDLRAAISARYLSTLQSVASIEDQVRFCRERTDRDGVLISNSIRIPRSTVAISAHVYKSEITLYYERGCHRHLIGG